MRPVEQHSGRDLVDSLWRLATSLRLAIPLAGCLALACALGSFVNPEHRTLAEIAAASADRWWLPLYRALELDDLFHSWWLLLLVVLLALNLGARLVERLPALLRVAFRPDQLATERRGEALPYRQTLTLSESDQAKLAAQVAGAFRAHGYAPEIVEGEALVGADPSAVYLFAERGRFSRLGLWFVHLSLFVILAGAVIGRLGGAEGTINAAGDGSTFDSLFRRTSAGTAYREPLGFTLRVDDFRLKKFADGSPRSFETDLAVVAAPGTPQQHDLLKQTVRVGAPLSYQGWDIYQAGYQSAPERDQVKLHLVDKQTREVRDVVLAKDGEAKWGEVSFKAINYTGDLAQLGPAVQLERTEKQAHTRFWVLQGYPDFDADNRGDRYGLRLDGLEPFFVTGLQLTKDPGYAWWLVGCCVFLLGLGLAFYSSHRRLWAKVEPGGKLTLAATAQRNPAAVAALCGRLVEALQDQSRVGTP